MSLTEKIDKIYDDMMVELWNAWAKPPPQLRKGATLSIRTMEELKRNLRKLGHGGGPVMPWAYYPNFYRHFRCPDIAIGLPIRRYGTLGLSEYAA